MNETESCNSDFRARELLEGADEQKRHELMQARGQLVPTEKIGISLPLISRIRLGILLFLLVGVAVIYRHLYSKTLNKNMKKHIYLCH